MAYFPFLLSYSSTKSREMLIAAVIETIALLAAGSGAAYLRRRTS